MGSSYTSEPCLFLEILDLDLFTSWFGINHYSLSKPKDKFSLVLQTKGLIWYFVVKTMQVIFLLIGKDGIRYFR